MQELTQKELLTRADDASLQPFAVLLYTPLCGTCQLTERMLTILLTMNPSLPIVKGNINYMPLVTREWQITSVPCVVMIRPGAEKQMLYRMQSVDELYRRLTAFVQPSPPENEVDPA
ncbi:thioredoxin family protein [Paenibacillus whitsoniae]|nr:thioredoxin family protein [Paenibacillus whitsoniae]